MRTLSWLTLLLLLAVAGVWPGFAAGLAQFVAVAAVFMLTGAVQLLARPPLLVLAIAAVAVVRLARRGWRAPSRPGAGR